jgi:hypothetical protein
VVTTFFLAVETPGDEEGGGGAENVGWSGEDERDGVGAKTERILVVTSNACQTTRSLTAQQCTRLS